MTEQVKLQLTFEQDRLPESIEMWSIYLTLL